LYSFENDGSNPKETLEPDRTPMPNDEATEEIEEKKMFDYRPSENDINI